MYHRGLKCDNRGLHPGDGYNEICGELKFIDGTEAVVTIPANVHTIGPRAFVLIETWIVEKYPPMFQPEYGPTIYEELERQETNNTITQTVIVPEGVHIIADYAFTGCEALTEVFLPASLQTLSPLAFDQCTNLREIYLVEGAPAHIAEQVQAILDALSI